VASGTKVFAGQARHDGEQSAPLLEVSEIARQELVSEALRHLGFTLGEFDLLPAFGIAQRQALDHHLAAALLIDGKERLCGAPAPHRCEEPITACQQFVA
jgi:hypothetical protein